MNNIFVGNLSFQATKEDLVKLFEPFGTVANAVIMERKKGKSRGYGFVDMPNEDEKNAAISALAGKEFMWRELSVSPVIPKVKGELSKKFKPAKKEWKPKDENRAPSSEGNKKAQAASKYYSKFDGPPKPWRKPTTDRKPARRDDQGARPYYGKKEQDPKSSGKSKSSSSFYRGDDQASHAGAKSEGTKKPYKKFDSSSKPWDKHAKKPHVQRDGGASKTFGKTGAGFKMLHKVSSVARSRPKE